MPVQTRATTLEAQVVDLNDRLTYLEAEMTTYRERHLAGIHTAPDAAPADDEPSLDDMTKAQLLEHAKSIGASPANEAMSKAELRDSIDAAG